MCRTNFWHKKERKKERKKKNNNNKKRSKHNCLGVLFVDPKSKMAATAGHDGEMWEIS
jgi:hypothetical protein